MPRVPWHTQILADQLTLFQLGGTDYAHLITTGTPGFSDLTTALTCRGRHNFGAEIHQILRHQTVSISSGQQNLMKTYHNEANTSGITKIALKIFLDFFRQSR